jgi:hypothetical protein
MNSAHYFMRSFNATHTHMKSEFGKHLTWVKTYVDNLCQKLLGESRFDIVTKIYKQS